MGQTNLEESFKDSQFGPTNGVACKGTVTKGACAAKRVRDGSMPSGGGLAEPLKTQVADALDAWVAGGQKKE